MLVNCDFEATDKSFIIKGSLGKHGEVLKATLYAKTRAIASYCSDMHKLHEYDGLTVCNVAGELTQIFGIYYHGDIYPLSRKTLGDNFLRLLHMGVGKGRGTRKNIYSLKRYSAPDGVDRVTDGEVDLVRVHLGNVILHRDLEQTMLGKDKQFIKTQCRVIYEILGRPTGPTVSYSKRTRLVGKDNALEPLVAA